MRTGKEESLSPELKEELDKVWPRMLGSQDDASEKSRIIRENIKNIQNDQRFQFAISKLNRSHEGLNTLLVYMQKTFPALSAPVELKK